MIRNTLNRLGHIHKYFIKFNGENKKKKPSKDLLKIDEFSKYIKELNKI
jgi:hypothetical protein